MKSSRRKFLTAAAPAVAVAAASSTTGQQTGSQPARKRVYRKLSATSVTLKGQPLYSPELSFGNLVFVSGKGAGRDATGDVTAQTKNVLDQIEESLKLAGSSMD